MRVLLEIELDTRATNRAIGEGRLPAAMDRVLEELRPEASYFFARDGQRCALLVVDLPDAAAVPAVCEPFWLEFEARIDVRPCMNADELREGLGRLGRS